MGALTRLRVIIYIRPWGYEASCIDATGNGIGKTPEEALKHMKLDVIKQQKVASCTDSIYVRAAMPDEDQAYRDFMVNRYEGFDIHDVTSINVET